MNPLLTVSEASKILRTSEQNLRKIVADGKLNHYKNPGKNGKILFNENHIQTYLETYCK